VLGLVAMEDVLEMLVGEVRDPSHRVAPGTPRTACAPAVTSAPAPAVTDARDSDAGALVNG
jgi:hypothetical protein